MANSYIQGIAGMIIITCMVTLEEAVENGATVHLETGKTPNGYPVTIGKDDDGDLITHLYSDKSKWRQRKTS